MTEGYYALGLLGEARKTAAVLGHNYPGSKWYINSYEMIENNKVPISITAKGKKVNIETVRQEKAAWYELWKKF
jgi:hypothetical protein